MANLQKLTVNSSSHATLPAGTSSERPDSPHNGAARYNTDFKTVEFYDGESWRDASTGLVLNGLIMHIDVSNPSCYPGTGSVLSDLSNNSNSLTMFNSPSVRQGFVLLNGTNQYLRSTSTLNLSPYEKVTIEVEFFLIGTSLTGMMFELSNSWNNNDGGWGVLPYSTGNNSRNLAASHTNFRNSGSTVRKDYVMVSSDVLKDTALHTNTMSTVTDSTGRMSYVNGEERDPRDSYSNSTSNYNSFRDDFLYVGSRGGTSLFLDGRFFGLRVYNRKLSSSEVKKNFNFTRVRHIGTF